MSLYLLFGKRVLLVFPKSCAQDHVSAWCFYMHGERTMVSLYYSDVDVGFLYSNPNLSCGMANRSNWSFIHLWTTRKYTISSICCIRRCQKRGGPICTVHTACTSKNRPDEKQWHFFQPSCCFSSENDDPRSWSKYSKCSGRETIWSNGLNKKKNLT